MVWPAEFKERAFLAIVDLIQLSMFLSVTPQVREASMVRGDSKDQTTLNVRIILLVKRTNKLCAGNLMKRFLLSEF